MKDLKNYYIAKYCVAGLFRIFDYFIPKKNSYWGFSVHHIKSDQFIENSRAVFEEIKDNREIIKVIFTRGGELSFALENVPNCIVVNLKSFKGLLLMLKCKVLFVTHSISMDYSLRFGNSKFVVLKINMKKRIVVNLWHGIPFKKLYALWNPKVKQRLDRVKYRHYERKMYTGLISSSEVDSYAMTTMFYPIKNEHVWQTGLPRNDFLKKDYSQLPQYLQNQIDTVRNIKKDKRLILYAPTYRQTSSVADSEYYQFTESEIMNLLEVLKRKGAILGIRLHYFRHSNQLFNIEKYIDGINIVDLGHTVVPEIAPIIRESEIVISDYSSVFIEAMYLDKKLIAFAYDYDHYSKEQDGVLYDFEMVFPGLITNDFNKLLLAIESNLSSDSVVNDEKYNTAKRFFYKYQDSENSQRVVSEVYNELKNE